MECSQLVTLVHIFLLVKCLYTRKPTYTLKHFHFQHLSEMVKSADLQAVHRLFTLYVKKYEEVGHQFTPKKVYVEIQCLRYIRQCNFYIITILLQCYKFVLLSFLIHTQIYVQFIMYYSNTKLRSKIVYHTLLVYINRPTHSNIVDLHCSTVNYFSVVH